MAMLASFANNVTAAANAQRACCASWNTSALMLMDALMLRLLRADRAGQKWRHRVWRAVCPGNAAGEYAHRSLLLMACGSRRM